MENTLNPSLTGSNKSILEIYTKGGDGTAMNPFLLSKRPKRDTYDCEYIVIKHVYGVVATNHRRYWRKNKACDTNPSLIDIVEAKYFDGEQKKKAYVFFDLGSYIEIQNTNSGH